MNFVRAVIKVLTFVKIRTYAKSAEELWLEEWTNPLQQQVPIENPIEFLDSLQHPYEQIEGQVFFTTFLSLLYEVSVIRGYYIDKIQTGFLAWTPNIKGYPSVLDYTAPIAWDPSSAASLQSIRKTVGHRDYFKQLALLWGQETSKNGGALEVRPENVAFFKSLGKF